MPIDVLDAFAKNLSCSTFWNRFTVISDGSRYSSGKGYLTQIHSSSVAKVYYASGAATSCANAITAHSVAW